MTVCPFCRRDPFHYVDIGVGMEAAAVVCCELGDLFFRGARAVPEDVTIGWDDFVQIGQRLAKLESDNEELIRGMTEMAERFNAAMAPFLPQS